MSLKVAIVIELCPAAFVTRRMKELQALRYVLESRDIVTVTRVPEGFLCTYEDDVRPAVVFEREPTVEYHRELFNAPRDWSHHVAVVEDALRRILQATKGANPCRRLTSSKPFKCKCCGHDDYIDCHTHYTCTKCAVVSTKVHQGAAYRQMRDRGDVNGCGPRQDPLFSDKFNRETFINCERLQRVNARTSKDLRDAQKFAARLVFEDLCSSLRLSAGVARKALVLFCSVIDSVSRLRNTGVTYAACMFHALEEPSTRWVA